MSYATWLFHQILNWKSQAQRFPLEDEKVALMVKKSSGKKFSIAMRPLSTFPIEVCGLELLEKLSLSNCLITSIPPVIGKLKRLKFLDLSVNQLEVLPPELCAFANLEELTLFGNRLLALPPEIGSLTNLKRLDVGCNELAAFPTQISDLKKLEEFIAHRNCLTELSSHMGGLISLSFLDISENPSLTDLPVSLETLKQLSSINILGTSIPHQVKNLILVAARLQRFRV